MKTTIGNLRQLKPNRVFPFNIIHCTETLEIDCIKYSTTGVSFTYTPFISGDFRAFYFTEGRIPIKIHLVYLLNIFFLKDFANSRPQLSKFWFKTLPRILQR